MQCYTELLPPSGVTHALSVAFTAADASNLLVARTSLLQVFHHEQAHHGQESRLVLVAEYHLAGTVTSLGKVKTATSKSGGDAVLVAFRDAKLTLLEWDPALHSISNLSIHYYEHHDFQCAPWQPDLADCASRLTVDPSSRCAAFNFGVSNLAILPFHRPGDDLAMEDLDHLDPLDHDLDHPTAARRDPAHVDGGHDLPYDPSFVLPLTVLDSGLLYPIDMAFLHEYRDPTIGILYSSSARSSNMSVERRDITVYAVYALDLEQKASTTLQSVQKLPNDLHTLVPLPLPVGGALLLGGNELIHVDQAGKSSAIAVNEFAKDASSFAMTDRSEYRAKLEGCRVEQLGNSQGDMVLVAKTGELSLLTFRMDGRTVSSMSLRRFDAPPEQLRLGAASCTANLASNVVFLGSDESDSFLLTAAKKAPGLKRTLSRGPLASQGDDAVEMSSEPEDDFVDEDDLYADVLDGVNGHAAMDAAGPVLRILDHLPSTAPIRALAWGGAAKRKRNDGDDFRDPGDPRSELAVAYGRGKAGGLAYLSRQISPRILKRTKYDNATGVWCFSSRAGEVPAAAFDDHVIVSQIGADGAARSSLFQLIDGELNPTADSEFDEQAGATVAVSRFRATNHTIQVLPTEIRVYDAQFALSQIVPVVDDEEGQLAKVVQASFAEPYVAYTRDDGVVMVLKADKAGELDELELPSDLRHRRLSSATLYHDATDFFQTARFYDGPTAARVVLSILTVEGHFCILSLPNLQIQVFRCESLPFLPTYLMQDLQLPRHWRTKDELAETLVADLGTRASRRPHLVVRNLAGDSILYEPFAVPDVVGSFKFQKVLHTSTDGVDEPDEEEGEQTSAGPMQPLADVGGYWTVLIPGSRPAMVMRAASTMPQIYHLGLPHLRSMGPLHLATCDHGFVFIDATGDVCFAQLPRALVVGQSGWAVRRVPLDEDVTGVTYFRPTESYVLATNCWTDFQLPQDDEWHPEWLREKTSFLPTMTQSTLQLLSPTTGSVISRHRFDAYERILAVRSMVLEVSEETHERKDLIVVGTAVVKGENLTARGHLYLFDVVDVVPEPGVPESDLRLKMVTKEEVRGAVSALCDVGSQGFLLAAQGQKCMVRGLKEDMSILPVAFLDMRYFVHVATALPGTGLCLLGDAFSGLWLVGYSEEPYKLQILGRDLDNVPVLAAEFLPDGKQLYVIAADDDGQLRVLQYDPEDPKSERGTKLLLRSTFNTGDALTAMTLVPPDVILRGRRRLDSDRDVDMDTDGVESGSPSRLLLTTQSGALCQLTSLPEDTYRRLSALQTALLPALDFHPCGLNARAYRQVETDGVGGRGIVDGNLVRRWWETSTQQRVASADKAGSSVWEVRRDMRQIDGTDLAL